MKAIGGASSDLSIKLVKELYKPGVNLIFSPTSIQLALGMLLGGSTGESNTELKKAVFSGLEESVVHAELSQLAQALNAPNDNYESYTANRLYMQDSFEVLDEYLALLAKWYGPSLKKVNFEGKAEAVRQEINKWVEEITKTRIKDLLPTGVIDGSTLAVIVNAIYFKGSWANEFNPKLTKMKDFYPSPSTKVLVPMMNEEGEMPYFEDDISRAVLLPYKGNTLGMLIIVPKERHGLAKVVQAADGEWFRKIGSSLCNETFVILQIPRFKIDFSMSMKDTLSKLGMVRLFKSGRADLSRLTREKGLYVSAVIHKAFLEVNEEGSEAAAATAAVVIRNQCAFITPPPIEMTVDQPFILAIWDREHSLPLFTGLVTHPKK